MQILHPSGSSVQKYLQAIENPYRWKPAQCPLCQDQQCLSAHGFYQRTVVDVVFDGAIRIYRYLCRSCRRTVSLLPEFLLPYVRFSVPVVGQVLKARLLERRTWRAVVQQVGFPGMPYQRGQHWVRRFGRQAAALAAALAALTEAPAAPSFVCRALAMWHKAGWISAHRFLFSKLRVHLLGWPMSLAPDGRCTAPAATAGQRSP